ncbi:piggyBac transposable element-derived protein 4-like [Pararge aegeria]|uniref:piggyBac transposable element-derived protein 4-like n=1 Tax=Pararge aegeria TaxID=116150 RepID=UPI0019D04E4D|nr:piggyBac transposable element-derived protein 4-like [Pararge aegeria]
MDYREGSPKPKRQRKQLSSVLNDSEIEEALYSDNSEDDYQPDDEESASESESEEHLWNIECRPPTRPSVLPTVQEQDLQPFTLTVSDSQGQGQAQINQPSASGSTSEWTTTEEESEDPIFKVRSVIDYFNNKMIECYYPAAQLSLDESMVLWRGRLSFRQFIKNKRHKYGIKLYMLTEPDGLILKFRVYAGAKDTDVTGKEHAEKVVMELLREKLNSGHELYMDNYYNSFGLAKKLLDHNTYCTGTLRKDLKDNPHELMKKKIKKGENCSMFRDGVHVGVWKDKRVVTYITTQYEDKMVQVQNKRGHVTQKPEAISKYNDYMSGVDRQDQLLAYYPCERKTTLMYNKYSGQRKMSLYDYRLNVINARLPEHVPENRPSNTHSAHKIMKATETTSNGRLKRKTCRQCTKNKKRTDSPWYCGTCPDKPGLCVECFENYHLELN